LTDRLRHIRRALRWCQVNVIEVDGVRKVSLLDVRRDALGRALDVEQTRVVVEKLVTAGWLRALPIKQTGGRPEGRWEVNSLLFEPAESPESPERQAQRNRT
jgi:hypothetical protein